VKQPLELPQHVAPTALGIGSAGIHSGFTGRGVGAKGMGTGGGFSKKKRSSPVRFSEPIVMGDIDRSLINRVIRRNKNQIRYCYDRELRTDPKLKGEIKIKFVISKDGVISLSKIKSSTLNNTAVEECVRKRLLRWKFPKSKSGITIVNYIFHFTP